MIRCQHCGQINSAGSNFCRFCGLKYTPLQDTSYENRVNFEHSPPRPYSWQTDEFLLKEEEERETKPINPVRPFIRQPPLPTQKDMQVPNRQNPARYRQNSMFYAHSCPRCLSQSFPQTVKKISDAGWIVFAVLLVTIFPLSWIGLLIKEEIKVCPVCGFIIK